MTSKRPDGATKPTEVADMPVPEFHARKHRAPPLGESAEEADSVAKEFAALTEALLEAETVAGALQRVATAARHVVQQAELVSITLLDPDGTFHTPIETDPVAGDLDQLQYETGEGPCVDAARMAGPGSTSTDDLGSGVPWPVFGPSAARHGYTAVLSTALMPPRAARVSGALNLYSRRPGGFTGTDRDIALLLATHASLALAATSALTRAQLEAAHLHKALDTRDVIGQAKGILMARRGIDADEAFAVLRHTSQDLNVKLAALATTLAERHTDLLPPE